MTALEALKRESKLSYAQIAEATGLSKAHVHQLICGSYPYPQDGNVRRIRKLLVERARMERSSDPEFLAQIRQTVVPFLRAREQSSPQSTQSTQRQSDPDLRESAKSVDRVPVYA